MITHNGTYLLHATHHGMPIVAATMGGKMVIRPWLLSATKQAIVAAFGAEGTEVIAKTNDYLNRIATTDPQRALLLAGFINEDPMLVCSLVETSKVRWVGSDGLAWVISNLKLQANDIVEVVGGFNLPDSGYRGSAALFGINVGSATSSWTNPNQMSMNDYINSGQNYCRFLIGPHTDATIREFPRGQLAHIKVDFGQKKKWVNGVQSTIAANFSGINMTTLFANNCMPFYATYTNGVLSTGLAEEGKMLSYFKVIRDGKVFFHGIPLVGTTNQGMVDIATGAIFLNQGTGFFTEHLENTTPA